MTALGTVYLVGAGCGAGDLLTLKAQRILAAASVVLVDDLVHESVLAQVSPQAQIIHVGKRGGCKSTPQVQIEELLVQHARSHASVVRLKGGDPLLFGRAGEELAALRAAGLQVEVVNGISAGFAAAAGLGFSLTHRDYAHGVVFITGHAQASSEAPKWDAIAHAAHVARLTVVIYMGISKAQTVQDEMLKALPASTPVAIVQNASLPQQRHALGTLGTLAQTIADSGLHSPSVMIVGDVLQGLQTLHA